MTLSSPFPTSTDHELDSDSSLANRDTCMESTTPTNPRSPNHSRSTSRHLQSPASKFPVSTAETNDNCNLDDSTMNDIHSPSSSSSSSSSSSNSWLNPHGDFSYLPPHATQDLRAATISIRDPGAIEPVHKAERCRAFTALVRRYMNQLLYGCAKKHCTTPTCFTCRKSLANGGVGNGREFTVLSARIIASHLATREDPYAALCDGKPVVPAMADEDGNESEDSRRRKLAVDHGLKDTRSFTQHLFDTKPLKMMHWVAFPPLLYKFAPEGWREDVEKSQERMGEVESPVRHRDPHTTPDAKRDRSSMLQRSNSLSNGSGPTMSSKTEDIFDGGKAADSVIMPPPPPPPFFAPVQKRRNSQKDKIVTPTPHSNLRSKSPPLAPPPLPHHNRHSKPPPPIFDPFQYPYNDYPQTPQQQAPGFNFKAPPQSTPCRPSKNPKSGSRKNENTETPSCMATFNILQTPVQGGKSTHFTPARSTPAHGENENYIPPPQTLSYLDEKLVISLLKMRTNTSVPKAERLKAEKFAKQSVFYVLSTPAALDKSFRIVDPSAGTVKSSEAIDINYLELDASLRRLLRWWDASAAPRESVVLNSLWEGLGEIYKTKKIADKEGVGKALSNFRPIRTKESESHGIQSSKIEEEVNAPPRKDVTLTQTLPVPLLDNIQTARMILISLHALAAMLPKTVAGTDFVGIDDKLWSAMRQSRSSGWVASPLDENFENQLAERLMSRIVRCLQYRMELDKKSGNGMKLVDLLKPHFAKCFQLDLALLNFTLLADSMKQVDPDELVGHKFQMAHNWTFAGVVLDWTKSLFLKTWEGKEEVPGGTVASGALELMKILYELRKECFIPDQFFETQLVTDRLDAKVIAPQWLNSKPTPDATLHLLDHQFLFSQSTLVSYFRSINMFRMTKAYEEALNAITLIRQVSLNDQGENYHFTREHFVYNRLKVATSQYIMICVKRETLVQDAFNYIYRRELRELRKPLKVKFMDQGEEGLDQGGPQQELFNILMKEVFNQDYGMFVQDPVSHINWFAICPTEPLHKYELLGALVGVAVYNGITLPLNFPRVMYMKLLEYPVDEITLDDIEDCWGPLVKGLKELLKWEDGDVGDIFMRTYEFSYELPWGKVKSVNIIKAKEQGMQVLVERIAKDERRRSKDRAKEEFPDPDDIDEEQEAEKENIDPGLTSSASSSRATIPREQLELIAIEDEEEAPLVTNENRHQYVRDYLLWLTTYSVHGQFTAFSRGFFSIIEPKSLTLFTPLTLQSLVEGTTEIDIDALEAAAKYDEGYHAEHPSVVDFWSIVKEYTPEMKRQLLEFVTASDRVPSNGIGSVAFVVQRSGGDSERVPTSMTCFGRLLLPEYESREKMKEKLRIALEHGRGFGVP